MNDREWEVHQGFVFETWHKVLVVIGAFASPAIVRWCGRFVNWWGELLWDFAGRWP